MEFKRLSQFWQPSRCVKMCIVLPVVFVVLNLFFVNSTYADPNISVSIDTTNLVMSNILPDAFASASQSITVSTTNPAGYTVTLTTDGSTTNLVSTADSSRAIPTFTLPSGQTSLPANNTGYGYGYSKDSGNNYLPVPDPSSLAGDELFVTSTANTAADNYTLTFGALVDGVTVADTYQGTFTLSFLANYVPQYTVEFDPNGGTGTVADQTIEIGTTAKLNSASPYTAPTGASYTDSDNTTITGDSDKLWTFWGWNTEIDGSGDWYKDREAVLDLAADGETITLYAQWAQPDLSDLVPASAPVGSEKVIDHDTMQDMSTAACYNSVEFTAIGTPYGQATLKDTRDGTTRTYNVAKLPDGFCWMTDNLNLGTSTAITLTSDDTDLAEGTTFTLPASDLNNFDVGNTMAITNVPTVLNDWTVPNYTVNGTTYSNKITGYYSYAAATADTSTYNKTSGTVATSICPKNWDLPTGTQYMHLKTEGQITTYNSTSSSYAGKTAGNEPYYFIYGGYRSSAGNNGISSSTSLGYLWTANPTHNTSGRVFMLGTNPNLAGSNKFNGNGIRCVAQMNDVTYTITYVNTLDGATQTKDVIKDDSVFAAPATAWNSNSYRLVGWDTSSAGTTIVYTNDSLVTVASNLTLYAVWVPTATIQYDGNGADAGIMTNVKHTGVAGGDVFDLYASNYSRDGYGFAGWSFDSNAEPGGSATIYGPNEALTAPAVVTPGETKTLYAVWVPAEANTYMQTWTGCSSMNSGDVTALKDQRDNNVYTVGKLADGNCWMMENLRLDNQYTVGNNINDSSVTNESLSQGYGGVFVGLADSESAHFAYNDTTANTLYSTSNIIDDTTGIRFPRYNNANTMNRATNPSVNDNRNTATSPHYNSLTARTYSYGNYYTWAAAMANTDPLNSILASESAGTSLCPSGWQLPYAGVNGSTHTAGSYYDLANQLGATTSNETSSRIWRSFPNNFILAGYYNGTNISSSGSAGVYWTTTGPANSSNADLFRMYYNGVNAGSASWSKYYGQSVRCLVIPASGQQGTNNAPASPDSVSDSPDLSLDSDSLIDPDVPLDSSSTINSDLPLDDSINMDNNDDPDVVPSGGYDTNFNQDSNANSNLSDNSLSE